jgi:sulfatase maturation enzyme AslB (radical SAM superfamily)
MINKAKQIKEECQCPTKPHYNLEVTTIQTCNMACTYCFEGDELQNKGSAVPLDILLPKIDSLLSDDKFNSIFGGVCINMWGGEPSSAFKYINEILEYYKDVSNVSFFMYTNGFSYSNITKILNNARLHNLANRFRFQVSYDGLTHDKTRVDHKNNGTRETIYNNILKLNDEYSDFNFHLKSVIVVSDLYDLVPNWRHFEELNKINSNFRWAPTLEYTDNYFINDFQLDKIRQEFLKLAKLESNRENHILSWFSYEGRQVCSAGQNIGHIGLTGNLSMCHGVDYVSPESKDVITFGHVSDDNLAESILSMREDHMDTSIPDHCKNCPATVCFQCPTVNVDTKYKNKEASTMSYRDLLHVPKTDLCGVYQMFGMISRAVKYKNNKK